MTKQFHSGDERPAELIDSSQPVELPTPDTDVPMVSRSVRLPLETYERVRGRRRRPGHRGDHPDAAVDRGRPDRAGRLGDGLTGRRPACLAALARPTAA
ncbi:hypothetical protein [Micromonospora rubida]|uniref:hypothetical protein n=1 Tax=Micromonospora rubida TaxID=2697657 RepID=UPI001F44236B|nr:hypothetical protein [Micromonospora rubida]